MQSAIERRLGILEYLCKQRRDTIENLAFEFGVSRSTIKRDIEILSISYPLSTSQGKGGGVYVAEWFKFGMVYLTDKQAELLKRLDKYLVGEDKLTLKSILSTYCRPQKGFEYFSGSNEL